MNNFSIRDIERLSGIKAHTLRIWEQRHGLSFSKRKESLHRYYDNEDLKQILRISYLYHKGYKISKIALLSEEEISRLANTYSLENNFQIFINQMIESSLDYDQQRFEKIIDNALLHLGFEKTVVKVFYPFMEKLGLLWMTDHLIPAQEHFSSYLVQKKIIVAIDGLETTHRSGKSTIILFGPQGEFHEIPLLVIYYLLKKNGINTVYFGANTCIQELEYYCKHQPATHLYFHLTTNFLSTEPEEYISCLTTKFPGKKIIASGAALKNLQHRSADVLLLNTFGDIAEVIRLLQDANR